MLEDPLRCIGMPKSLTVKRKCGEGGGVHVKTEILSDQHAVAKYNMVKSGANV